MTTVTDTTATQTKTATQKSTTGLGGDFNTFLTLLTAQLKNQDPTQAMDTNQMTQQLVQFASVEQQINMNTNLGKLIGLQQTSQLTAAAPLMGRQVEVESDQLPLQDGAAVLRLPAGSGKAVVTILDAAGRTLRQDQVTLTAASQDWAWNGLDAKGKRQPDGAYRFTVTARDSGGTNQSVDATVVARATAAERQDGDLRLVLGSISVGFDAVRRLAGE
ncbi:flagellar hook assembly protein FlgD [Paracraurococcus lichenis]|uniref:Basal-body rod modification protein FlgD n=1 Tax=Paracraurococcus lichenis TaxID=3064888 RepID=A0ABT9E101_9PROT|nr:flagellar hook assembly protein FlgD [Paracraurococcus sp. LOR1-02]MDO9709804.1 flagellar hook assembly protein FlgD [Paracraurococcus sp. LOR1-02]